MVHHGLCYWKLGNSQLQAFSNANQLYAYSDANWVGDVEDRHSQFGYCMFFGCNPLSWCSRKQNCISRSSIEAEYRELTLIAYEIFWQKMSIQELQLPFAKL
jgi:hypothetical protein